jgi:hypothetical protein
MKKSVKKDGSVVKEYVQKISNEDLTFILERLDQPLLGDRADVSLVFQKDEDLDKWLSKTKSADEWFDKLDIIQEAAIMEMSRRQGVKSK